MHRGVCEVCGFGDDSYRIEEDGVVLKVCKFCHDGYMERKSALDAPAPEEEGIPFDDIPPEDLEEIERELADIRAERKVATLDEAQLGQILAPTEDDKRVLGNVRRRQLRAEKKAAAEGKEVAWIDAESDEEEDEDASADEIVATVSPTQPKAPPKRKPVDKKVEKIRAEAAEQKKLLRMRIQGILNTLEQVIESDEPEEIVPIASSDETPPAQEAAETTEQTTATAPETATTDATPEEVVAEETPSEQETSGEETPDETEEVEAEEAPEDGEEAPPAETEEVEEEPSEEEPTDEKATEEPSEEEATEEEATEEELPQEEKSLEEKTAAETSAEEQEMEQKSLRTQEEQETLPACKPDAPLTREQKMRRKIQAQAHQTIDDERIRITSPEVELRRDKRPKTNFDVATSEYVGGVRFLDTFRYVLHKVSYTVFLALIVLAVCTVSFVIDGWQHALILFGGGVGAVGLGFLLMWYLSHCYETDRRALLLRIRQQEILFDSMDTDCYRELRTKFTMIKALGWLLTRLSVLIPLLVAVGGNVAAVIVCFRTAYYWLFPVISAGATVASVLMYYIFKFCADCVAYKLDRERNQQIEQQTLLDILGELRRK